MRVTKDDLDKKARAEAYDKRSAALAKIIRPITDCNYSTTWEWRSIKRSLESLSENDLCLELNPDFQRGHVWTPEQQQSYIENCLRGCVANQCVQFNCPTWEDSRVETDLPRHTVQCIDGLQRLTAIIKFMDGGIQPFGLTLADLEGSRFSPRMGRLYVTMQMFTFTQKADLLQHYIDYNTGGTVHSAAEIARVTKLVKQLRNA